MTVKMRRPNIAVVKAHVAAGTCSHQDRYENVVHSCEGWRTDFSFYDHDKSTDTRDLIAYDCENHRRPCAEHQCYELMHGGI